MSPPRTPTLIEIAVEPREARDRPALLHALAELAAADPASEVRTTHGSRNLRRYGARRPAAATRRRSSARHARRRHGDARGDRAARQHFGYRNSVRTMSRGVGTFVLAFSHFEPMPRPEPSDLPGVMAMRA